ncbi:hypothetical protein ACVDG3_03515 [Meridianimarinicoccus sp. RP-17]|uniref:hypothetical protein n=1 Tax=Meridianimarinicoccus zhengii TaxID=2056810 RepID=UPI000DAD6FC4|nr:hypothetical protein [Phycocomes zhengii]
MSQSDSFIEEVTEEVRRDRLFALARRYGWIVALALVLVIGGAALLEWRKAQERAAAQDLGDRIFAALEADTGSSRATRLAEIDASGAALAVLRMLEAGELAGSDAPRAGEILKALADDPEVPPLYRDLATLKLVLLADYPMFAEEKLDRLDTLTAPGAPFRLLAQEQMALLAMETGDRDRARDLVRPLIDDAEAQPAQRQRAAQLFVVLGGDPDGQ